jgi:lecithin-cholesterol acyltransferase
MVGFGRGERSRIAVAVVILGLLCAVLPASTLARKSAADGLTPIVIFPAFHFTRLRVDVHGQTVDPACPADGSFQDWFLVDVPSDFSQVCQDELLTLRYDANPHKPMPLRFSNQHGVRVTIADYGSTKSAPFYEPMYAALEGAGYTRDKDIRVAGYDSRLAPDAQGWLQRTKRLIEETSRANGDRPVHLTGHSNGPIYAQYVLTHASAAWKHRYIQGFTPIAGNFPGQGGVYPLFFTGLNVSTFTFPETVENAVSSARLYLSAPSTYLSSADPIVFGDAETVMADASTGKSYTPADYGELFDDAGVTWAHDIADYYIGGVPFVDAAHFPNVDVYAEKGSGIETLVGLGLPDLTIGQLLGPDAVFYTRDGDINQEDLTNDAVGAWAGMSCWHFSLTDNPGVNHFELPSNGGLLARLIAHANAPRSDC